MAMSTQAATIHKHVQSDPASTWDIVHGQNMYPVVDVYISVDGVVEKILPSTVVYVDSNTVRLTFSENRTGFATVV